jgi:hypothetical protein
MTDNLLHRRDLGAGNLGGGVPSQELFLAGRWRQTLQAQIEGKRRILFVVM